MIRIRRRAARRAMTYGSLDGNGLDGPINKTVLSRRSLITSFVLLCLPMLVVTLYFSALPMVGYLVSSTAARNITMYLSRPLIKPT